MLSLTMGSKSCRPPSPEGRERKRVYEKSRVLQMSTRDSLCCGRRLFLSQHIFSLPLRLPLLHCFILEVSHDLRQEAPSDTLDCLFGNPEYSPVSFFFPISVAAPCAEVNLNMIRNIEIILPLNTCWECIHRMRMWGKRTQVKR